MKLTMRCLALAAAIATAQAPNALFAQTNDWVGFGSTTNFADGGNWSFGFAPSPDFFAESRIGSDSQVPGAPSNPLATVSTNLSGSPSSALVLGDGVGFEGTLSIASGGQLSIQLGAASPSGNLTVGRNGGVGILQVDGSGQLQVGGDLVSAGGATSELIFSGSASVSAATASFDRNLRIAGPSVNLATTGNLVLGSSGVHEWEFNPSGSPSRLLVGGQLNLGGTLKLDTLGIAPAIGASYVIADSSSVVNSFSTIDLSNVPGLGLGVRVRAQSQAVPGSVNGFLTSVVVEQQPVAFVNRQTGEVTLRNPGTGSSIDFDIYIVGSDQGNLAPGSWTSIAPNDGWEEANPTTTAISELNPLSSQSLAGGASVSLGPIFQPNDRPFGDNHEDATFRFAPIGGGLVQGLVVYEGIPTDTLTLNVDRTTGAAQIINGFRDQVSIDTYVITSESASLDTGIGGWSPLGNGWEVAISEPGRVSELNPIDKLDLASNAAASLGDLFAFDSLSAEEDLVFQFTLPNENFFRTGKVVFADELTVLPQGLQGDYNDDGFVNAADYTVWRDNLNQSAAALNGNGTGDGSGLVVRADYDLWVNRYGSVVGGATLSTGTAVPEPAAAALVSLACLSALRKRPTIASSPNHVQPQ